MCYTPGKPANLYYSCADGRGYVHAAEILDPGKKQDAMTTLHRVYQRRHFDFTQLCQSTSHHAASIQTWAANMYSTFDPGPDFPWY